MGDSQEVPERTFPEARLSWVQRRREKIAAEIERNRRGDYRVPTWVLVMLLVAFVGGWVALIIFA